MTDTTKRKARCSYYGQKIGFGGNARACSCDTCKAQPDGRCHCERPSAEGGAFFSEQPDKPYDDFYCGCAGWD